MITDIHCHFVPKSFFRFVESDPAFAVKVVQDDGAAWDLKIRGRDFALNSTFYDAKQQIARLDRLGIDRTILSLATPFIDYALDPALALKAARVYNDGLAETVLSNKDRFGGWAFLPIQDPQAAADELRRCVREYGFIGGHVGSNVKGTHLHDPQFAPVLKAACELDVPLFVHPADPAGKERMTEFDLTVVAGYLFDNTLNILKIVCSGVMDEWPGLKLVFAHTGAFGLILRARMQCEIDTNPHHPYGHLKRKVGDYLREFYYDTACFEPAILRYATEVVPVENLLMGSDAPFPLVLPNPATFVREALSPEAADLVLHKNFDRLIGR